MNHRHAPRLLLLALVLTLMPSVSASAQAPAAKNFPPAAVDSLDYRVLLSLQQRRTPVADRLWVGVSGSLALAPLPAVGLSAAAVFTHDPLARPGLTDQAFEAALALFINAAATSAIKNTIRRPRPWIAHSDSLVCIQHVSGYSFPSGHTSFTFAAATSLSLLFPRWYIILPSALWACSVGYSRLYIGAHYPSDVLVGALVGTGSALLAHWLARRAASAAPSGVAPIPAAPALPIISLSF